MTARIKYFTALVIVMALIYVQQDFVIYAEGDSLRTVQKEGELLPEGGGNLSGEESGSLSEGNDNSGNGGNDNFGDEGDGDSEGSGNDNSEDGGDENAESGGNEKPGDGEEEKPGEGEEDEKKIEKYEVKIPKTDGKEGYYISKPEILIKHVSQWGVTKYCFAQGDKKTEVKMLKEKGDKAVIEGSAFSEGKNVLHIWMEDEEGEKLEEFDLKKEILIDTKAPEIHMSVPKGFEAWYQGQVVLSVSGDDSVSGVEKLSGRAGDRTIGNVDKDRGEFVITQTSLQGKGIEVTVTAQDRAGNKSERVRHVYIDGETPEILISGIKNYMITGKDADIAFEVDEENMLQEYYAQITWENVRGKKKQLSVNDWETDGTKRVLTKKLKNDGTYYIKVHAKDMSGHVESKEMQIMIDKTDPVIRYAESLRGKFLKRFQWNYSPQKMIWDFTTYTYEIRLDGRLYHMGDVIEHEGTHRMMVKVTDAAGNKAEVTAQFVIDHTAPGIIFYNIEEGEEYEEERTFKVELERAEDTIRQIQINGENQKIMSGNRTYEYTLDTCQDYEVTVKADDRAGNETEKTIYFQIIPKKSLMGTIAGKVKSYGNAAKDQETAQILKQSPKQEKENIRLIEIAGIGMLGILFVFVAVFAFLNKKSKAVFADENEGRENE